MSENLFKPEDLIVKSWSSKNKGNWSTVEDNGIFIYHKPTQTEYKCDSERSQHKNRQVCFDQLNEYLRNLKEEPKTETKLKQRNKRKSISKSKFWRVLNHYPYEKVESDSGCVIAVWAETKTHIYYFDPKRKLYFRGVL